MITDTTIAGGSDVPHQEQVRDVDTDAALGLDPWRPLHKACERILVSKPQSDGHMQRVAALWGGRRDVELGLYGYAREDLEFLRDFGGIERLNIQSPVVRSLDGLRHVADSLKELTLIHTTVRLSLRPVANCTRLESLHLQRQTKDFAALRALKRLRYLGLSGVSQPDLSALLPYEDLQSLFLGFCKPVDLGLIGRFGAIEALHLLKVNNLHDLSALRLGRTLKRLELQWLPHVETLPDLGALTQLEEVEIETMKALRDVSAIAAAPALRFIGLWDCPSLVPESFECLRGHPALKRLNYGIGSVKKNAAVEAMFPEEMTQPVNFKIAPGTWLRRPTA
jgi:hypothetical protein